jgi:hypothetical protein
MKERPIKELLQIVLFEGDKDFKNDGAYGLCGFSVGLIVTDKITTREYLRIRKYINKNRPKPGDKHYRTSCKKDPYFWRVEAWGPRRKWLKDQINQL